MTTEEMSNTFSKFQLKLEGYVYKRYRISQDRKDIVMEAYGRALKGKEYEKVPLARARTWWYYKVRAVASEYVSRATRDAKALRDYQLDMTAGEHQHEDLSEKEGLEVLQEYWDALPRYTQTRTRQQWQEEGQAWLPFMYPKT